MDHLVDQKTGMLRAVWTREAQLKKFQKGTIIAIELETFLHFCKECGFFLPLPWESAKTKLKCLELISFAEEISRQSNTDSIVWSLVIALVQIDLQ